MIEEVKKMKYVMVQKRQLSFIILLLVFTIGLHSNIPAQGTIIDHNCTDITKIPESAINQAKQTLHIGYGHTSHGSQLTTGMTGLVSFANNGGLGLSYVQDIFAWNNGGTNGALDLEDRSGLANDCGYFPGWVNETRAYLDDPSHSDVNVIIWSWCGQVSGRSEEEMVETYLSPMSQLESDYPNITFVYMTGHADGTGESGNLHLRNQQIRDFCIANNKVLYDFYDIECYNPDDDYFGDKNVRDDCSYTGGNWAIEWQNSHTEGVDWYSCSSAHSQPLNANRKAYAAWWLWATLAGWDEVTSRYDYENINPDKFVLHQNFPNPFSAIGGSASGRNPGTTIPYKIPALSISSDNNKISLSTPGQVSVTLKVYNILGREVATLINEQQPTGDYTVRFDASGLPSGIYFYELSAGKFRETKKMQLLK